MRGRGLWAGVEFASLPGRQVCEGLAARGVLAKDTHGTTIRLAPPLTISQEDLDWALDHVLGYTCLHDVSARDLQFGDGQWVRGKSLDTFCPIGPAIVPA